MLRIYPVALSITRDAAQAADHIARKDPDLARQLRRASVSVPLNIAEGTGGIGKTRTARYADALGSARETAACLDVAAAIGYIPELAPETRDRLDHVIGVLVKIVH